MNDRNVIRTALETIGIAADVAAVRPLSGGCIHHVVHVTLDSGDVYVVKIAPEGQRALLEEESAGLCALSDTKTLRVPDVLGLISAGGCAALVMEALPPAAASIPAWEAFGSDLARLHAADAGDRYGFDHDNHLGTTAQPNGWCDDWVVFNQRHRLGHQLCLAEAAGLLQGTDSASLRGVIDELDRWLPRHPKPALLHGDLWSGNALPTIGADGAPCIAVIDPACSIGDGWADIAMMLLFGGFPPEAEAAYRAANRDHARLEQRIVVYQLYHILNHVNIFGSGYLLQMRELIGKLLRDR